MSICGQRMTCNAKIIVHHEGNMTWFCVVVCILSATLCPVLCDYPCLCCYAVEKGVHSSQSPQGSIIAYLYEFDCKPLEGTDSNWYSIAYEHKLGYVEKDSTLQVQVCQGDVPGDDKVPSTLPHTTASTTLAVTTNRASTSVNPTTQATSPTVKATTTQQATSTIQSTTLPTSTAASITSTIPATRASTTQPTTSTTRSTTMPTSTLVSTPSTASSTTSRPTTTSTIYSTSTSTVAPRSSTTTTITTPSTTAKSVTTRTSTATHTVPTSTQSSPTTIRRHTTAAPPTTTKQIKQPITTSSPVANTLQYTCPSHIQQYVTADHGILFTHGHNCYEAIRKFKTWQHAENDCILKGGHLAHIQNPDEQRMIYAHVRTHLTNHNIWIGLHDQGHEAHYVWTSGDQVSYAHWYPLSNDRVNHDIEDCVALTTGHHYGYWEDLKCNDTHAYLCQFDAVLSTHKLTIPPQIHATQLYYKADGNTHLCSGAVYQSAQSNGDILGQHGSICYEILPRNKQTFQHAESTCRHRGGNLAHIRNAEEQAFIESFMKRHFPNHAVWIGLHDLRTENHFEWTSGDRVTYTNWLPAHTSNFASHTVEDCVVLIPYKNGKWDDIPCGVTGHLGHVNGPLVDVGETHPILCQYNVVSSAHKLTLPPQIHSTKLNPNVDGNTHLCSGAVYQSAKSNGDILGQHGSSCYELIPRNKQAFQHAESTCRQHGGNLAHIRNAEEQAFIESFIKRHFPNHSVWIGLHDLRTENHFEWTSGEKVSYTNWLPGHTSNFVSHHVEDCVVLIPYKNGKWDDIPCGVTGHLGNVNGPLVDVGNTRAILCQYRISAGASLVG